MDNMNLSDAVLAANNPEVVESEDTQEAVDAGVEGFVISENGMIVAKVGFFTTPNNEEEALKFILAKDSIFGKAYVAPINLILGFAHENNIPAVVDSVRTSIVTLKPEIIVDDKIELVVDKAELTSKLFLIVRAEDVEVDLLEEHVKEQFVKSTEEAKNTPTDLTEIEQSYNLYLRHLYKVITNPNITETALNTEN